MSKPFPVAGDFLNVDVELICRRRLTVLVDELKKWILYDGRINGGWLLSFETNSIRGKSTPDGVISKLCKLIHNLSPAAKLDWESAQTRVFDIGFESAPLTKPMTFAVRSRISTESLKRIADLDATLNITCYRHFDDIPERQDTTKAINARRRDRPPLK